MLTNYVKYVTQACLHSINQHISLLCIYHNKFFILKLEYIMKILSIKIQELLNLICAFNERLVRPENVKIKNFLLKKLS